MLKIRIDLTRMECKATFQVGHFENCQSIDLTRMECKVFKNLNIKQE